MITEEQKYDSSIFKNIGFAFLTPIGSIAFQTIVLKKPFLESNYIMGIIVLIIGCILIFLGRIAIKEKK